MHGFGFFGAGELGSGERRVFAGLGYLLIAPFEMEGGD